MSSLMNSAAEFSNVATQAFLVRVIVSKWTARKLDKEASKKTTADNGATEKAGVRTYKSLVSGEALETIAGIETRARSEHRKRTVPWVYDGPGAIAGAGYADYVATMAGLESEFNAAVSAFVAGYAGYREAQRANLGSLFNDSDYPAPELIRDKFGFVVMSEPMPRANDFRSTVLDAESIAKIQADIESRFNSAMAGAQREAWQRIEERVGHMAKRLREYAPARYDTDGKLVDRAKTFHASLVENVQELVKLMPSLNVTGDSELSAMAERMQRELCAESAGMLKDDETLRESVAQSAENIMRDIWTARRAARGAAVESASIAADATGETQAAETIAA
jgi:hypothetical protein